MRTAYLNGQFLPESELKISAFDLSVMQGAAAFEMTRSFHGKHFKLVEHLRRLEESCKLLHIPFPKTLMDLEDLCHAVSERNHHGPQEEHRLLVVVSPGCAGLYRDCAGVIDHPYVYISDFPLRYTVRGLSKYFSEGVPLVRSGIIQINSHSIPARAKHRSRAHFHMAAELAKPDWALMCTDQGYISEGPGFNLCAVFDDTLVCVSEEALPGISQQTVAELAVECNLRVEWSKLEVSALQNANEVWITGTPFCALPVSRVEGRPVGNGTWPMFHEMLARWGDLFEPRLDIKRQIEAWDLAASRSSTSR